jgi:hypothetical protein
VALNLAGCTSQPTWTVLFTRDGLAYAYDATTLRRARGDKVRLTVLREGLRDIHDPLSGDTYRSARLDWEFDCAQRSVIRHATALYTGAQASGRNLTELGSMGGAVYADPQTLGAINRTEREARPERIVSGSPEDEVLKRFCGQSRP